MVEENCLLNRDSVAAGIHEVAVIGDSGPATVRTLNESGEVVFEGAAVTDARDQPRAPLRSSSRAASTSSSVPLTGVRKRPSHCRSIPEQDRAIRAVHLGPHEGDLST